MKSYFKFSKVLCDQPERKERAEFWVKIGWLCWLVFIAFGLLMLAEIGGAK